MQVASVALSNLWGIESPVERTTLGVSRTTWRVADGFWLTGCEAEREAAFRRECNLLQVLDASVKADPELRLIVPDLIPTRSGDVVSSHSGLLWRLTHHIEGVHPSPHDPATYEVMVNLALRLHEAFDAIVDPCPACPDFVGGVRERLWHLPETLSGSLLQQKERDVLHEAADWLKPKLDRLSALPTRIVHGDWTPLNVLIRRDGWAGILDFEACRRGPAVLDFANICSTLLMWSSLDRIPERMAVLVSAIQEKTGLPIDMNIVQIAMMTHWFGHYFEWQQRERTNANAEVARRLLGRIETVLQFTREADR
jgi:Ser/Thr protein kinase RdoA (MazF antagonist)